MTTQQGRLPTFVVIGAMRSGTTALNHWLEAHPDVTMAPQKEVHFFDRHFERGPEWYRAQFAGGERSIAVGEATPGYMANEAALDRMAQLLPDARLVALLRNPVDRAYSHYWQNRLLGKEPLSFLEAIEAELAGGERRKGRYLAQGRYLEQLESVTRRFPRSSLHVLIYEELMADPAAGFGALCRFIGVSDERAPAQLGRVVNAPVRIRSLAVRRRTRHWPKLLRAAIGRVNTTPFDYPPMQRETRAQIEAWVGPQNDALASWLGRDLRPWRP